MAELIEETLSKSGLERYEISNYARVGRPSRHNLNYWQGGDYLGVGAGHTAIGGSLRTFHLAVDGTTKKPPAATLKRSRAKIKP